MHSPAVFLLHRPQLLVSTLRLPRPPSCHHGLSPVITLCLYHPLCCWSPLAVSSSCPWVRPLVRSTDLVTQWPRPPICRSARGHQAAGIPNRLIQGQTASPESPFPFGYLPLRLKTSQAALPPPFSPGTHISLLRKIPGLSVPSEYGRFWPVPTTSVAMSPSSLL